MADGARAGRRVVFGVPVYNGAPHLEEALDSLLAQSYEDFGLVVVDNCSSDATADIAQAYSARDARVRYRRNPETVGMIDNWRRTFETAVEEFGGFEYFAFGSDHDVWHPEWLASLVPELDADPAVVVAYPLMVQIREDGKTIHRKNPASNRLGDTAGIADPVARVRRVESGAIPNAAYGLFRARALERCGILHETIGADRLLMSQLALLGTFKQVPRELWKRRYWDDPRPHQRRRLFTGRPRGYSYLPFGLVHAAILFRWAVLDGLAAPEVGRVRGIAILGVYSAARGRHRVERWRTKASRTVAKRRSRAVKRRAKLAKRRARGARRTVE